LSPPLQGPCAPPSPFFFFVGKPAPTGIRVDDKFCGQPPTTVGAGLPAKRPELTLENYLGEPQFSNPLSTEPQLPQHLIRMLPQRRANMPRLRQPL